MGLRGCRKKEEPKAEIIFSQSGSETLAKPEKLMIHQ